MKKSIRVRVLCLIVATIMLSGAVAFAAVMGSPYETLKNALLDALTSRNATQEGSFTMTVNGVVVQEGKIHSIVGDDSLMNYSFDDDGNITGYYYFSKGLTISPIDQIMYDGMEYGAGWYSSHVSPPHIYSYVPDGDFTLFDSDYRNSAQMRFIELLADALVGDLKNNITMTSENGIRYIRGTLTESQVPELIKAGIDMLIEQTSAYNYYYGDTRDVSFDGGEYIYEHISLRQGEKTVETMKQKTRPMTAEELEAYYDGTYYSMFSDEFWGTIYIDGVEYVALGPAECVSKYTVPVTRSDYVFSGDQDDLFSIPMKSFVINYVHGEAEVDKDGNLLNIGISATATVTNIFGEVSEIDIKASIRFSDIGTSNPVCPIPGAEQLLTTDYMSERFGGYGMAIYFTLNEDGSIDADSITTTHPIEKLRPYDDYSYTKWEWEKTGDNPAFPEPPPAVAIDPHDDADAPVYEADGTDGVDVVGGIDETDEIG